MSITSIAALGGGYNFGTSPYTPPPTSTRSITQLANGSTITTTRGTTGDVLAVTTAVVAAQNLAVAQSLAAQGAGSQDQTSTFYVTA
jgi:hypothetical protein